MLVQHQGLLILSLLTYVVAAEEANHLHQAEFDFKAV